MQPCHLAPSSRAVADKIIVGWLAGWGQEKKEGLTSRSEEDAKKISS